MAKKNVESRKELAAYSTLPEELEVLANDKSSEVRYRVAVNPYTPAGDRADPGSDRGVVPLTTPQSTAR